MDMKDLKKLVREVLLEISLKEDRNAEIQKLETLINDIKTQISDEFGIDIGYYDDPDTVLFKHEGPSTDAYGSTDPDWHKDHERLNSLTQKWQDALNQLNDTGTSEEKATANNELNEYGGWEYEEYLRNGGGEDEEPSEPPAREPTRAQNIAQKIADDADENRGTDGKDIWGRDPYESVNPRRWQKLARILKE